MPLPPVPVAPPVLPVAPPVPELLVELQADAKHASPARVSMAQLPVLTAETLDFIVTSRGKGGAN
jgi:hypothetical protein